MDAQADDVADLDSRALSVAKLLVVAVGRICDGEGVPEELPVIDGVSVPVEHADLVKLLLPVIKLLDVAVNVGDKVDDPVRVGVAVADTDNESKATENEPAVDVVTVAV